MFKLKQAYVVLCLNVFIWTTYWQEQTQDFHKPHTTCSHISESVLLATKLIDEQICLKMSSELWASGFQIFCYVSRGFIWSLENSFYFGCYRISQLWTSMTFPHLFGAGLRCVFHLLDLSCLFRCPWLYLNKWSIYLYCVITYYLYLLPIFSYSKCSWSILGSMTEMFTKDKFFQSFLKRIKCHLPIVFFPIAKTFLCLPWAFRLL